MGVNKINGFRAPYRSLTFRDQADALANSNGVLSMDGVVTADGGSVVIPPFVFIQNGLIVEKDVQTSVVLPTMPAPFYLKVNAATVAPISDLSFQFAKSPEDIATSDVLIAEYDGSEWITRPFVSVDGVYKDIRNSNKDYGLVGPFSGLQTVFLAGNYFNSDGVIVDKAGRRKNLATTVSFPEVAADPDFNRVDRIVYRKPVDSENRIGVRRYEVGGSYSLSGPTKLSDFTAFSSTTPKVNIKTLIASDNSAHVLVSSGYGNTFEIKYVKQNAARTANTIAEMTLFSGVTTAEFDAGLDKDGNVIVIYFSGEVLYVRRFTSSGVAIGAASVIDSAAGRIKNYCKLFVAQDAAYVVYRREDSPGIGQIYFAKLSLSGSIATAPKDLTNSLTNLIEPDLFATDDYRVYVAWNNPAFGRIYLREFDDVGVALADAVLVSGATSEIGFGTLIDDAKQPKVWVTESKNVYVTFLQNRGSATYRPAIWKNGSASMPLLSGNNTSYALYIDNIHEGIHLLCGTSSGATYYKIEDQVSVFSIPVITGAFQSLFMTRDVTGSMHHSWTNAAAGSYTVYDAASSMISIGPATPTNAFVVVLNANQCLVSIAELSQAPKKGDRLVVTGDTGGANGTYYVDSVESVAYGPTIDSYRITITTNFASDSDPAVFASAAFASPTGNAATTAKSTSETQVKAYRYTELESDILLARIVMPGNVVLNYVPGGTGGTVDSDLYTPLGTAFIDWGDTTAGNLTIVGDLRLIDLLNNLEYVIQPGSFAMNEADALYLVLDGTDSTPTPQVTSIATLPFGLPIQVLGIIKNNAFCPHLLGLTGMGAIEIGESVGVDNSLPVPVRQKLGIQSDTSMEPYTSVIGLDSASDSYPKAISKTNIMAGQNKHIKFINATISWQESTANTLKIHKAGYLAVPGLPLTRNKIDVQDITLASDGMIAYVNVNREAGANASLTVMTIAENSLSVGRDTVILARRIGDFIVTDSLAVLTGQRIDIDDPFTSPLKLKTHPTDSTKIMVQSANALRADGSLLTLTLLELLVKFDGAVIDTVTGDILDADGVTPLGYDYVVPTIAAGKYRWFSVTLKKDSVTADNRAACKLALMVGDTDGSTLDLAPKPAFDGELPIGQFYLQRNAGDTANEAITSANFYHLNPGAGAANELQKNIDFVQLQVNDIDTALAAILANVPESQVFIADGSQTTFNLTLFTMSANNTKEDLQIFADGRRLNLATSGVLSADYQWKKNSTTQIQLFEAPGAGVRITVYKQGTSSAGSVNFGAVDMDLLPDNNGVRKLGNTTKAWEALYLKDTVTAQVYRVEIANGVFQAATVP